MKSLFGISGHRTGQILLLAMACALSSCEKPKLRSNSAKETVESSPPGAPVDPFTTSRQAPATAATPPASGATPAPPISPGAAPGVPSSASPDLDPAARAKEYARIEKMLAAQLAGIRSLESDYSRHASSLNQLNSQLNLARARQAGSKRGGVRVERLGGESTLVDHKAEIRDLEMKIKAEEPLVVQLSTSLQRARQQYADLQRQLDQLLVE